MSQHPAEQYLLAGVRPATAGKQVLHWLLDGLILWLPFTILGLVAAGPFFTQMFDGFYALNNTSNTSVSPRGEQSGGEQTIVNFMVFVASSTILLLIYFGLYWWMIAVKGQTPGMRILGLRLVSVETGQPIGWGQAFIRGAVVVLGTLFSGGILGVVFWLSPLFDTQSGWNQALQDKLVKAVAIDVKTGRDPFRS